jgi:predicted acetyltransferase
MSYEVRTTAESEWRAAADTMRAALLFPPSTDADWETPNSADTWRDGLSLSAWDGSRCVGHAGALDFEMMVPGGARVPMAGVTRVGVLSTHRRRGVLTAMMDRLLRESVERGQVVATLRASEGVIYQRFGFQVGGEVNDVEIDCRRGARLAAPVAEGTMRLLTRDDTFETVKALHPRVGFDRPGAVARKDWALRRSLADALAPDKGTYVAVHTADGIDDGYVVYSVDWPHVFGANPGGTAVVSDVWAATPAVELALWKYVLEIDLLDTVRVEQRPPDDPLRFALADQRHYVIKARFDEQWVRLLDVHAALHARTYNGARDAVTVAVSDPLLPANDGTWRISAEGAERQPGGSAADLVTTINGISGAYLGGTSWRELCVAGVVQENRPGAVAIADLLFAARPQPRCGTFF